MENPNINLSIFERLNRVNVNGHTEKKGTGPRALTYLSWAWAWAEVKKAYPMSYYTIYENRDGLLYHTDGHTCWVKTGVTIVDGDTQLEHIEYLPVMDHRNESINVAKVTSFDVNKAIQRSLTKACARHGLGLYIYAGEDLPEDEEEQETRPVIKAAEKVPPRVYDHKPELNALMQKLNTDINGFAAMYAALIEGGIVPAKKSSDMVEADWKLVFRAIESNFLGEGVA